MRGHGDLPSVWYYILYYISWEVMVTYPQSGITFSTISHEKSWWPTLSLALRSLLYLMKGHGDLPSVWYYVLYYISWKVMVTYPQSGITFSTIPHERSWWPTLSLVLHSLYLMRGHGDLLSVWYYILYISWEVMVTYSHSDITFSTISHERSWWPTLSLVLHSLLYFMRGYGDLPSVWYYFLYYISMLIYMHVHVYNTCNSLSICTYLYLFAKNNIF
jgi:hypothetical protein